MKKNIDKSLKLKKSIISRCKNMKEVKSINNKKSKKNIKKMNKRFSNKWVNSKYKNQKGGDPKKYITIANDGHVNENGIDKYNQCIWISIRDYLNNFLFRKDVTVQQIKHFLKLDVSTDREMFDIDIPKYSEAIELFAKALDIRIVFYHINRDGDSVMTDIFNKPVPRLIINETSNNIVAIASYGLHFELIIMGPDIPYLHDTPPNRVVLEFLNKNSIGSPRDIKQTILSSNLSIGDYKMKVLRGDVYVTFEHIESEIESLIDSYRRNNSLIISEESKISLLEKKISEIMNALQNLKADSKVIESAYKRDKNLFEEQKKVLEANIDKIKANNISLIDLILLKKRYVELMQQQESLEISIALLRKQQSDNQLGLTELDKQVNSNGLGLNQALKTELRALYESSFEENKLKLETFIKLLEDTKSKALQMERIIASFTF